MNTNEQRYDVKELPPSLFDTDEYNKYKTEWQQMPEFVQGKLEAYTQIIFRFSSEEDLQEFAKLIGQPLNKKTKSAWYPKLVYKDSLGKRYVDES